MSSTFSLYKNTNVSVLNHSVMTTSSWSASSQNKYSSFVPSLWRWLLRNEWELLFKRKNLRDDENVWKTHSWKCFRRFKILLPDTVHVTYTASHFHTLGLGIWIFQLVKTFFRMKHFREFYILFVGNTR